MAIEDTKCSLCGKKISGGETSWSSDNKDFCSGICQSYHQYPTRDKYLQSIRIHRITCNGTERV